MRGMRFAREVRGQLETLTASRDWLGPGSMQRAASHARENASRKRKLSAEHAGAVCILFLATRMRFQNMQDQQRIGSRQPATSTGSILQDNCLPDTAWAQCQEAQR